jgi:hypothetical protein
MDVEYLFPILSMIILEQWINTLASSLQDLWAQLLGFLPALLGAFIVFFIGLIVATGLEKLVERIIYYLKIDMILRKAGIEEYMKRIRVRLNSGHFVGRIVFWFIVVAFLLAASDILGFFALSEFLKQILNYIPNVLIAAFILIASLYVAHFLRGVIRASVWGTGIHAHAARTVSAIAWWGVIIFGFLAALTQLRVAEQIVVTLVTGLIAMIALAGGLAFGLGGREIASRWLAKMEDTIAGRDM